jgi:hypothetical protein
MTEPTRQEPLKRGYRRTGRVLVIEALLRIPDQDYDSDAVIIEIIEV